MGRVTELVVLAAFGMGVAFAGCGSDDAGEATGAGGGAAGTGVSGSAGTIIPIEGGTAGTAGKHGGFPLGPDGIPIGFTSADVGAWMLGEKVEAGVTPSIDECGSVLLGVVRDFQDGSNAGGHPDFETFMGDGLEGIVEQTLGSDRKPVYAHTGSTIYTTTPENFRQWYVDVPAVNQTYAIYFYLEPSSGIFTFESNAFFPLDGEGWGDEGNEHNFHFTTELHTRFKYNGGETFRFIGDDDLWVFINNELAIDLGGLHSVQEDEISLDAAASRLGITTGNVYALDLFHAERHTSQSNFRVDSNLEFIDCGEIIPNPR